MNEVPSHWFGRGHAPHFNRSVALASAAVAAAEAAMLEAMRQGYPLGSQVTVIHHRGAFDAKVIGWDKYGVRVIVENTRTRKRSKWWAAHVETIDAAIEAHASKGSAA